MREKILLSFGEALGVTKNNIVEVETPDGIYLKSSVIVSAVSRLTDAQINNLLGSFGDAIQVEIGLEGLPDVTISSSYSTDPVRKHITKLGQGDSDDKLTLELTLNKSKLIGQIEFPGIVEHKLYYLFGDNLKSYLSNTDTIQLSRLLFHNNESKTGIVLAEGNVRLVGKFLYIVSENELSDSLSIPGITQEDLSCNQILLDLVRSSIRSIGFQFPTITPLHFQFSLFSDSSEDIDFLTSVYQHFVTLFILFTANLLARSDSHLEATYASASGDQISKLSIIGEHKYDKSQYEIMSNILKWLYGQNNAEKLRYFQTVTAKALQEEITIETLLSNLGKLYRDAQHYYAISIEGKVTKNFESIQSISRYINQINSDIGKAIDDLTKGLSDTIIAAIAVVIGGLITALTGGKTTTFIFSVLMMTYVIYIVVFQLILRMSIIWNSYDILSKTVDAQVQEYTTTLGLEKLNQLTIGLKRRKRQFKFSFWITFALFVLLASLFILIAWKGPEILINIGALQPNTNTVTPASPTLANTQLPSLQPQTPVPNATLPVSP